MYYTGHVFPAHAGMSLAALAHRGWGPRFPRSRGDEPLRTVLNKRKVPFSPLTRG